MIFQIDENTAFDMLEPDHHFKTSAENQFFANAEQALAKKYHR